MTDILVYSKDICPHCVKAKNLLNRKGAQFTEIKVTDDQIKEEMIKKSGGRMTVPQIFIDDFHVGGCDDLHALEASGRLDALLKK
ncbi:MAG: glutaredoxin 3 [Alphaproteobacteria bacterium]|nr:glutaredoxin 3 [Alphaproteobacteria bacterium]